MVMFGWSFSYCLTSGANPNSPQLFRVRVIGALLPLLGLLLLPPEQAVRPTSDAVATRVVAMAIRDDVLRMRFTFRKTTLSLEIVQSWICLLYTSDAAD